MTTWGNTRVLKDDKVIHIYNQIDFILCPSNKKHTLINARSYAGLKTFSDHRLVKCKVRSTKPILFLQNNKQKTPNSKKNINCAALTNNKQLREKYKQTLNSNLQNSQNHNWKDVSEIITHSAETTIGYVKKTKHHNITHDPEIEEMSKLQKEVRLLIDLSDDAKQIQELRNKRNILSHNIRKKQIENHEKQLDARVKEINKFKDSAKMFKAVNTLKRKPFENPYVVDDKEKRICNLQEIHTKMKSHFEKHFNDNNAVPIEPFVGPPKPLNNPISSSEVKQCVKLMNNNKSPGHDNIPIELIKYGTEDLYTKNSQVINNTFEHHTPLEVGKGLLVALPKPGKTKGPVENLRPIILLPIIRKIISTILLQRTKPKVDQYLSASQSAYRPGRSTSDIVFAHRWLLAKVQTVETTLYLDGIDMTAAFRHC